AELGGSAAAGRMIWERLGQPDCDVSSMKDIVQLRSKNVPRPAEPFTLQSLLSDDDYDVRVALGTTQDTRYPHAVKRRQLLIRALNELMDKEDLAGTILGLKPREGSKREFDEWFRSAAPLWEPVPLWAWISKLLAIEPPGNADLFFNK